VSVSDQAVPEALDDERRLHELGYALELRLRISGIPNFELAT